MHTESTSTTSGDGVRAFFSFHIPTMLFPPSAIISLTDDNSTFFLARPADFGPRIPSQSLSGQLWVGSGFGDDTIKRGGAATGAEGELGCSDVPGWEDGDRNNHGEIGILAAQTLNEDPAKSGKTGRFEGTDRKSGASEQRDLSSESDGTDDHLHNPLHISKVSKPRGPGEPAEDESAKPGYPPLHADIQSLQESAEIAGKVVLLSRGGCGFLEKVKWVQRRGGTALIVGDDTRGGALITMYARGDTSNVTIPSLFTSHTTAHLLSSLIPVGRSNKGRFLGDTWESSQSQELAANAVAMEPGKSINDLNDDRPRFTPSLDFARPTPSAQVNQVSSKSKRMTSPKSNNAWKPDENEGWFTRVISRLGIGRRPFRSRLSADSRRPPSSGRLAWINEKWDDEARREKKVFSSLELRGQANSPVKGRDKAASQQTHSDDFVIGVQDWRDPDLVAPKTSLVKDSGQGERTRIKLKSSDLKATNNAGEDSKNSGNTLAGGIITPGSGEYEKPGSSHYESEKIAPYPHKKSPSQMESIQKVGNLNTWLSEEGSEKAFRLGSSLYRPSKNQKHEDIYTVPVQTPKDRDEIHRQDRFEEHEGLWVTLTPTTMSTSPFFDTLLVLVVSPLVTLTVVYALLLLRSRIRRRRWRAPKSVVDRLPVRVYHTMSCSSTSSSSRFATPKTSSPATPLLQSSPQSGLSGARPRSRTASSIIEAQSVSLNKAATKASVAQIDRSSRAAAWKKKYTGKQIECVVCLEEYVDGHSRVMSLPCGHEFHAECM